MSGIHFDTVRSVHGYTRSEVPWQVDENRDVHGQTATGRKFGWKLFHYLSGGGMRNIGRGVREVERDWRQTRVLVVAGIVAAVWIVVLVF